MKNLTKFIGIIAIGAVIMLSLAGCATTVPIKSVRMPTIDTSSIKKLGIDPRMSFENRSGTGGSLGAQLTQYLSDLAYQKIQATGKFELVSPSDPNADGVFFGEIRNIQSRDSHETRSRTDKAGNTTTTTTYRREVSVVFVYGINSKRTGMPIGTVTKQGSLVSFAYNDPAGLTSELDLSKRIASSNMGRFEQDIVPVIVSTNVALMEETSKDKAIKQMMKDAQALVKNGNYRDAINLYDDIDSKYSSVAAKNNAGILRRAIESDTAASAKMSELDSARSGLIGKAVKSSVDMINKLPAGSLITIMKTSSTEINLLNDAVGQIEAAIVSDKKIRLVDRTNQALINAEQKFQMSGSVDDSSAVSIGKTLGVKYMVLCNITGVSSSRKINIRILSVETSQVTELGNFEI